VKQIKQAVTEKSLFLELQHWCRQGAGKKRHLIQIMSAFASGPAVEVLEPFFDVFLSDGNAIEIIIGIDRNGTSRGAIDRLYELQHAYTKQISCRVFHAPSNISIFHPKLYLFHTTETLSAMIGSANLTLGGLAHNFESIFLYRDISRSSNEAKQIVEAWNTFADLKHPLKSEFLRPLTTSYARELMRKLPERSQMEKPTFTGGVKAIWKPISRISLPRSGRIVRKRAQMPRNQIREVLVIDVLKETRETQMQFPLAIVEGFFGLKKNERGDVHLSQIRGGQLSQPIERRIVKSGGMRRIEMPQIAGKTRPLAAVFLRFKRNQFSVMVLPQRTPAYRIVNQLLSKHGQQPKYAIRRYYVGAGSDRLLAPLRAVLGSTALSRMRA
jgi:HKD family nuclease